MEQIRCPTPLPENPVDPLLMRILVLEPYQAPAKKDKKKKKKEEGASDAVSGEADAQSSHEGDDDEEEEEEEEEEDPPRKGMKMAATEDLEAEASKRDKITLSDDSESDAEAIPKHRRQTKPQANS